MAFSEELAERIRQGLTRRKGIEEKKMYGAGPVRLGEGLPTGKVLDAKGFTGDCTGGVAGRDFGQITLARRFTEAEIVELLRAS